MVFRCCRCRRCFCLIGLAADAGPPSFYALIRARAQRAEHRAPRAGGRVGGGARRARRPGSRADFETAGLAAAQGTTWECFTTDRPFYVIRGGTN